MRKLGIATLWVLGGGALVAFVFVVSFYVAMKMQMRSTEVTIPDLVGLDQEEAARVSRPLGLVLDIVDRRHDPALSSGRVIQQEPPAGAAVRRGRKIKVVLSLGSMVLEVPDLVGHGARRAEIELARDGFVPAGEARVPSDSSPTGTILAQVPSPESPAVPGSRMHLLVSDGPRARQWVMPDLKGRTREKAEAWIDLCGFRRGPVRQIELSNQTPGAVVGQLPLAGYPISTRGVVELTVAR